MRNPASTRPGKPLAIGEKVSRRARACKGQHSAARIGYVVVGRVEHESFGANQVLFRSYPLVREAGGYRLYAVP